MSTPKKLNDLQMVQDHLESIALLVLVMDFAFGLRVLMQTKKHKIVALSFGLRPVVMLVPKIEIFVQEQLIIMEC